MLNKNNVSLVGIVSNLTEVRKATANDGKHILFDLRCNSNYYRIDAWDEACETVEKYVKDGDKILVRGWVHSWKTAGGVTRVTIKTKSVFAEAANIALTGTIVEENADKTNGDTMLRLKPSFIQGMDQVWLSANITSDEMSKLKGKQVLISGTPSVVNGSKLIVDCFSITEIS